jgi:hypothetical protein
MACHHIPIGYILGRVRCLPFVNYWFETPWDHDFFFLIIFFTKPLDFCGRFAITPNGLVEYFACVPLGDNFFIDCGDAFLLGVSEH